MTSPFPFLFYGTKPLDYRDGGTLQIRFASPPDAAAQKKLTAELRRGALAHLGADEVLWKSGWLLLGFDGFCPMATDVEEGLRVLHALAPIEQVVNLGAAADSGDEPWERWSIARRPWPEPGPGSDTALFFLGMPPAAPKKARAPGAKAKGEPAKEVPENATGLDWISSEIPVRRAREVPAEVRRHFQPGDLVHAGPGKWCIGFRAVSGGWELWIADAEGARRAEVPVNGEYPACYHFRPDGERLLLFPTFLIREVTLATGESRLLTAGGALLGAGYLDAHWALGLYAEETLRITPEEPDSVEMARECRFTADAMRSTDSLSRIELVNGDPEDVALVRANHLEFVRGGRAAVLRRSPDPLVKRWLTALLAFRDGELRVLGRWFEDVGEVFEQDGAILGVRGFALQGLDAALERAFLPETPKDADLADRGKALPLPKPTTTPGEFVRRTVRLSSAGVKWTPELRGQLLPRAGEVERTSAAPRPMPRALARTLAELLDRPRVWDAGEKQPGALAEAMAGVRRRHRPRHLPAKPHHAEEEATTLAMVAALAAPAEERERAANALVDWWCDAEGPGFALKALLAAFRLRPHHAWRGADVSWITSTPPPDGALAGGEWVGPPGHPAFWLQGNPWLRLRWHLAALEPSALVPLRSEAEAVRAGATLPVRALLALAFAEPAWAAADAKEALVLDAPRAAAWAGHLFGALDDAPLAIRLAERFGGGIEGYAPAYGYAPELLRSFGAAAAGPLAALTRFLPPAPQPLAWPQVLVPRALEAIDAEEARAALDAMAWRKRPA